MPNLLPSAAGTVVHPDYGSSPIRYEVFDLSSDPDTQVAQTLEIMRAWAVADARHPYIQQDAQMCFHLGNGDPVAGAYQWVKNHMEFVQDETKAAKLPAFLNPQNFIEVLTRPVDASMVIRSGAKHKEDCDGFTSYLAALLIALGVPCSFATVAAHKEDPSIYSHVYVVAYPNGQRVPLDSSHGEYPGWEAPNEFNKFREWPVNSAPICSGPGMLFTIAASLGILTAAHYLYKEFVHVR